MAEQIYKAICDVMADIGAVGKNSYNSMQKFNFRGIDAVMNAIYPALCRHNVFVVPEILEQIREERQSRQGGNLIYSICKIKYTFYTADGSSVSAVTIGEGMDSGDKATNKAMAIALKYAFFQVFCIPTEEMDDPDAESPEPAPAAEITLAEKAKIEAYCAKLNYDPAKVIKGWPHLTRTAYEEVERYLAARIAKKENKEKEAVK